MTHPFDVLYIPYIQAVIIIYTRQLQVVLIKCQCYNIWVFGIIWMCSHVTEMKQYYSY